MLRHITLLTFRHTRSAFL